MVELDAILRGATIGIALLLGAVLWRARPGQVIAWTWLFFTLGIAAYVLAGDLAYLNWRPLARLLVGIFALATPFFFWLFVRLVFDDEFQLRWFHFLWLAAIEIAGIAWFVLRGATGPGFAWLPGYGFRLLSLVLIAHSLWVVWRGRSADLVEARAHLRVIVAVGAGLAVAFILLTAIIYEPQQERGLDYNLAEALILLATGFFIAMRLLRLVPDFLPVPVEAAPSLIAPAEPSGSAEDGDALARLERKMTAEEGWRETGLTIGALAKQIGVPEYRLRRLINQQLGFRNFTAFLNEYRLAAAARRLGDRAEVRIPILTIALELGWGSIGPFNRAFRARYGVPPSDYRRERLELPET